MNWKSTNVYYLLGIGIPLVITALLGMKIIWPSWWVWIILTVLTILLWALTAKIRHMPRPLGEYRDLKILSLELPKGYDVELYTCETLDQYSFTLRIAELLQPMRVNGQKPKVVVNPRLLEQYGEQFMRIAVVRELERHLRKYQLTTILHLILPVFAVLDFILFLSAFNIPVSEYISLFILQFVLPFVLTLSFLGHLVFWNKCFSQKDYKLDSILTTIFPTEDVRKYITAVEELERRLEKKQHTAMNEHYTSLRLKNLEKSLAK